MPSTRSAQIPAPLVISTNANLWARLSPVAATSTPDLLRSASASAAAATAASPLASAGGSHTPPTGPNYSGSWIDLSDDDADDDCSGEGHQHSHARFSVFGRRTSHRRSSPSTSSATGGGSGQYSPTSAASKRSAVMGLLGLRRSRSKSDNRVATFSSLAG